MKIIISPTKTMKRKSYKVSGSPALFEKDASKLRDILKKYSVSKIKKHFKISDKLTDTVYNYYQTPQNKISAINLYEGLAFKNMGFESYKKEDFDYLEKHLLIL